MTTQGSLAVAVRPLLQRVPPRSYAIPDEVSAIGAYRRLKKRLDQRIFALTSKSQGTRFGDWVKVILTQIAFQWKINTIEINSH